LVFVFNFEIMLGSVLAAFISFGVPANHLIAASVMAAPGALGFAKLLLPETHKSKTTWETVQNVPLPYVLLRVYRKFLFEIVKSYVMLGK
jgi:nucleoside permease NupC